MNGGLVLDRWSNSDANRAVEVIEMMRWTLAGLVLILSFGEVEGGPLFYSIDVQSGDDELVKVDALTGEVISIGSLGPSVQLEFPSLAVANGRLYLVNPTVAAGPVELLELNPSTGEILSSTQVNLAGNTIPLIEGFDSNGSKLLISYGLTSGGGTGTRSNRVGTLALDGTITDSVTLSASDDLDGIAVDQQGQLFGADASSPNVGSDILTVSLNPPATTLLTTIGSTETDILDLAFTDTGLLFGLDVMGGLVRRIHQIDPATGESLSLVSIDPSRALRGPAFVPEPSALLLALFSLAGVAWRRKRVL